MNRFAIIHGTSALALVSTIAGTSGAHAEVVDIAWTASGGFERKVTVPAGKFVEICGPLERGETVRWAFESTHPLDFNVHYHVGKDVHYPSRQDGARSARGTLDVQSRQDYCWMWSSKQQAAAELSLTLEK